MVAAIDPVAVRETAAGSLREAITIHLRERIRSGALPPHSSLPSTRELAAALGTSAPNVHQALRPLVREGLLTRHRRHGTTVTARPRTLARVVTYMHHWNLDVLSSFQVALVDAIGANLRERGIEQRLVVDTFNQFGLEQLGRWTELDEVQGVIMPFAGADVKSVAAIAAMPVPAVFMVRERLRLVDVGGRRAPCRVRTDWRLLADLGIAGLRDQGCRRVGVIGTRERLVGEPPRVQAFYRRCQRQAVAVGLDLRPDWLRAVSREQDYLRTPDLKTRFAYEQCGRLLDLRERPDGIFVTDDGLILGALLAILERHLEVPRDVKLVVHRNWELKIAALPPCVQVGLSIAALADALVRSIVEQFNGRHPGNLTVPFRTVNVTGE